MPAVGTPEPNGASYQEIIEFLLALRTVNLVGVDLVEFNPLAADFIAPCVVAANLIRELCCLLSC
jgi:arginase family enzyme